MYRTCNAKIAKQKRKCTSGSSRKQTGKVKAERITGTRQIDHVQEIIRMRGWEETNATPPAERRKKHAA